MTVQTNRHRQYTLFYLKWARCRACNDGEDAIKTGGETYLPRIGQQDDADYDSYKQRARFYTAFSKSIKGFVGLALRKPLIVNAPDSMDEINNNIDRKGADIRSYAKTVLSELLTVGRVGTLIDYSQVEDGASLADTEGARPYWAQYRSEDILDWEYVNGVLTYLVVREFIAERSAREDSENFRYRVCEMIDGVYVQRIYQGSDMNDFVEIIPKMNNASMKFIPFVMHQVDFDQDVQDPPLLDLANLSISHYQLKADHMHALHYVALPTPWITGVDAGDEDEFPYTIGPQKVWGISAPDAKVGMLEFTGQGVSAIKDELESMEDQMAIIGSRVLLPEISEKTATASKLRSISETSDLASIVLVLERQLNQLEEITMIWAGASGDAEIVMDTNFLPRDMDAQMLTALVGAWQSDAFDQAVLTDNLQKAEIIPPETDIDEMLENIDSESDERLQKAAAAIAAAGGNDEDDDDGTNT